MLDSTGEHFLREIPCFLCNSNSFAFEEYVPTTGHDGYALKSDPCIVSAKDAFKARFFKIKKVKGIEKPVFEKTFLIPSPDPYHYRGYLIPQFGESLGCVVFVCKPCLSEKSDEKIQEDLRTAFVEKLSQRIGNLTKDLFFFEFLRFNGEKLRRTKLRVKKSRQEEFEKRLRLIENDLSALEQSGIIRRIRTRMSDAYAT